jgi:hypothetical protein
MRAKAAPGQLLGAEFAGNRMMDRRTTEAIVDADVSDMIADLVAEAHDVCTASGER